MDLDRLLAELLRERDLIDQAIAHLERLPSAVQSVSSRSRAKVHANEPQEKVRAASANFD